MTPIINDTGSNNLQKLNYLNAIAYISNVLVVGFGATALSLPDNATLSEKYQTLITPAPFAFSIWGIIFLSELIWTIGQCLPAYRSTELVVKGVGYNYVFACVAQCIWTILFGLEKMTLSLIAMISILIPLLFILNKTSNIPTITTSTEDDGDDDDDINTNNAIGRYWLLKFPFEIHAAWIMAATLVNMNVVFVAYNASAKIQTIIGWTSLVVVLCVGIAYTLLLKPKKKQFIVVPCVLIWASFAITSELSNPKTLIMETFSENTIQQTKIASAIVGTLLSLVVVNRGSRFLKPTTEALDDDNSSRSYTSIQ